MHAGSLPVDSDSFRNAESCGCFDCVNAGARNIKADRVACIRSIDRFTQSAIGSVTDAVVMIVSSINSEVGGVSNRLDYVADIVRQDMPQPKTSGEQKRGASRGCYSGAFLVHASNPYDASV